MQKRETLLQRLVKEKMQILAHQENGEKEQYLPENDDRLLRLINDLIAEHSAREEKEHAA